MRPAEKSVCECPSRVRPVTKAAPKCAENSPDFTIRLTSPTSARDAAHIPIINIIPKKFRNLAILAQLYRRCHHAHNRTKFKQKTRAICAGPYLFQLNIRTGYRICHQMQILPLLTIRLRQCGTFHVQHTRQQTSFHRSYSSHQLCLSMCQHFQL